MVMRSDCTDLRRLIIGGHGDRFLSNYGSQRLVNDFGDPGGSLLYSFTTEPGVRIRPPVRTIFPWPRDVLNQQVEACPREMLSRR